MSRTVSGIQARLPGSAATSAPTLFAITILVVHVGSSLQLNKSTKTLLLARRHRMMTKCEIAERLGNLDIQRSRRRSGASRENGSKAPLSSAL